MADWVKADPIVIVEGKGACLFDSYGLKYLDANSSIWTNLHGHRHPALNRAIAKQLGKIAHSSALGLANEPASFLAERLIRAAALRNGKGSQVPTLEKVFYSDDGSTAMEVALKLAYEFARRSGRSARPRFLSLSGAYHGDTVGAVSMGHIDLFHETFSGLLFRTDKARAPYCYRCPYNRAKPERADARDYAKCGIECLSDLESQLSAQKRRGAPYAAFVFEPLMQGAAGMIAQPRGWLRQATTLARDHGALLIADEVMTGFGRMGAGPWANTETLPTRRENTGPANSQELEGSKHRRRSQIKIKSSSTETPPLFACQLEGVSPDFMALAKGLTGGYLPMAATLTTKRVYSAFLGRYDEFKTFFHGHSFTGNQLGAAASLASLDLLQSEPSLHDRIKLEVRLRNHLQTLWDLPQVGDIRQVGLTAGIELVRNWRTREPFTLAEQAGIRVCKEMTRHGVITRPIGNVIVLMPPYCTTDQQLEKIVDAFCRAVRVLKGD
jgi:adenosylmethionine---8-amino-7-oxononanoate aminotransferase